MGNKSGIVGGMQHSRFKYHDDHWEFNAPIPFYSIALTCKRCVVFSIIMPSLKTPEEGDSLM